MKSTTTAEKRKIGVWLEKLEYTCLYMQTLHRLNFKNGFTVVELLVVVAIIGILSTIIIVSLSAAKYRANDTKRKADLKSMGLSLVQYYSANGAYPATGVSPGVIFEGGDDYIPNIYPTYTNGAPLPNDPEGGDNYSYTSDGSGYKFFIRNPPHSAVGSTQPSDEFYDPVRPTTAWMVCSGRTACTTW